MIQQCRLARTRTWRRAALGGAFVLALIAARSGPVLAEESSAPDAKWLKIDKDGDGSGLVSSSPSGIHCGSSCQADFPRGKVVTLTAYPSSGSLFGGWTGDCSGDWPSIQLTLNGNRECTAWFFRDEPKTLTVLREGSGNVSSSPPGINCGSDCSQNYPFGTSVRLTATPASGWTFVGWSGGCTKGLSGDHGTSVKSGDDDDEHDDDPVADPVITFRVREDVTCKARFAAGEEDATLTIDKIGTGSGRVTSSPLGIDCGFDCQQTFELGKSVQLTATASTGSRFVAWGGDCSGTSSTISVSLSRDKTCTARFDTGGEEHALLRVTKSGTGSGRVTSNPGGIDCGSDCQQSFDVGTTVQLTATASSGSMFVGWTGDCSGTSTTISVPLFHDKTCNARFDAGGDQDALLQVTKTGTGSGVVTSSPSGIHCGSDCQQTYDVGTTVQLTATASSGSVFVGWSGDCSGTNPTISVPLFHDKTCSARFDVDDDEDATLVVTKTGTGSGFVSSSPSGIGCGSDCQQTYDVGTTVQLTATASSGSVFVGWSGDCSGTNTTISVPLFHDKTCTARFDAGGGGGCQAELSLDNVGGSCEGDIEASLMLSDSSCILRGVQLTIDDVPNWLELVACERGSTLHSSFGCSINDDGDKASLFIVSTSGGQIPIGVQPRELARLTFRGTGACIDDCTTDVRLDLTQANVADQDNNPVSVVLDDAVFSPCEGQCGTKGDVDCDHDPCTLFDVLGAIDQALHDSDTCEADVFECDSTVDLFDVVCLIDCALDRPSHCLSGSECQDGDLPSGCDDKSRFGGDSSGSATLILDYDAAPPRPGTLDVRIDGADRPVRGVALTFQLPSGWDVAQVRTIRTPESFSAKFHQTGRMLRILMVSDFAELLPTDVASGLQIQFTKGRQVSRERQRPVLLSAEAADADRVPMNLTVRHD